VSIPRVGKLDRLDTSPLVASVGELDPIRVEAVDHTPWEPVWNEAMRRFHYLGHRKMLGARLKQLVFSGGRPIAALGWRAASLKLEVRDAFIGWSVEQRNHHLASVANNNRFLIFDWVRVPNLGSHLLSRARRAVQRDWHLKYGHRLLLLETFVDPRRFRGTVYRAANWIHVGATRGFTKDGRGYRYHGHPKEVFVYVLESRFRTVIGCRQRAPRLPVHLRPTSPVNKEAQHMLAHQNDWHPHILEDNGITPEQLDAVADTLVQFHEAFHSAFNRPQQRHYSVVLLKGLLSDAERKCLEPIALRYMDGNGSGVRNLQRFMTESPWDEEHLGSIYRVRLAEHLVPENEDEGVLTLDSSEFPKKGKESVGVARQYCGNLGKVESCQSGVFAGYTSPKGYGLIDGRLFLPETWFSEEYQARRDACGVPDDLSFQTKPEIALEALKAIRAEGRFRARWLAADETFGNNPGFRQGVAGEGLLYFVAIPSNFHVWPDSPEVGVLPYKGRGPRPSKARVLTPSVTVEEIAQHPDLDWRAVTLAEGSKGPIVARVARLRVIVPRDSWPDEEQWLFLRQDVTGKIDYYLSNAPAQTPFDVMCRVCTLRWPIEQSFREGKTYLGMDHYEHRSWRGWHRFMLHVFLAMLFLWEVRMHLKKGAPSSRS
jgi:SRSO17 transposase